MRLGIISDDGAFYAPRILTRSSLRDEYEIAHVWVRSASSSTLSSVRHTLKIAGPGYVGSRSIALARLRRRTAGERSRGRTPSELTLPTWSDLESVGLPVSRIDSANSGEYRDALADEGVDLLVSLFFGEILEEDTFEIPRFGAINVHPSPLPELAGKNPVFWAMAEGLQTTAVTVHRIDVGIDTGAVILQRPVPITPGQTHHALYEDVCDVSQRVLPEAVRRVRDDDPDLTLDHDRTRSYRSTPTRAAYRRFRANGHRFLSTKNT